MLEDLITGDFGLAPTNLPALILGLLLAFAGGHVLAWVYMITHSGLSYSRSFVKSLIVMPIAVALVMHVLANNLVTAFGMMAVFAIVRFRNMLRDTLDTTYILLVLVLGMAAGSQKFTTAVVGLALMAFALLYLWLTSFGSRHRYDVIMNLHWSRPIVELARSTGCWGAMPGGAGAPASGPAPNRARTCLTGFCCVIPAAWKTCWPRFARSAGYRA